MYFFCQQTQLDTLKIKIKRKKDYSYFQCVGQLRSVCINANMLSGIVCVSEWVMSVCVEKHFCHLMFPFPLLLGVKNAHFEDLAISLT